MRLVSFAHGGQVRMGVVVADGDRDIVVDVTAPLLDMGMSAMEQVVDLERGAIPALTDMLAEGDGALNRISIEDVTLLPPVTSPSQMLFVRANYPALDGTIPQLDRPAIFSKVPSALIGDGGTILLPPMSEQVDWEAELALVIGRHGSHVAEEEAFEYIAGYTVNNDITARDLQAEGEPALAKNFRTFSPLGPWMVTADEVADPSALGIRLWVNDKLYQDGNTGDMIFGIPEIIAYLSSVTDLRPGDVVATGAPAGVGKQQTPPVFLGDGDEVRIEVQGIGTLTNPVARSSS